MVPRADIFNQNENQDLKTVLGTSEKMLPQGQKRLVAPAVASQDIAGGFGRLGAPARGSKSG